MAVAPSGSISGDSEVDEPVSVDLVFDGPPGPEGPRFIEAELTEGRRSVSVGEWLTRDDGYTVLRVKVALPVG